jgi:hypothetical protein
MSHQNPTVHQYNQYIIEAINLQRDDHRLPKKRKIKSEEEKQADKQQEKRRHVHIWFLVKYNLRLALPKNKEKRRQEREGFGETNSIGHRSISLNERLKSELAGSMAEREMAALLYNWLFAITKCQNYKFATLKFELRNLPS